jgi:hypothetical protein
MTAMSESPSPAPQRRHGRRARQLTDEERAALEATGTQQPVAGEPATGPLAPVGGDMPPVRGAVATPGADAPLPRLRKFGKRARIIEVEPDTGELAAEADESATPAPAAEGPQEGGDTTDTSGPTSQDEVTSSPAVQDEHADLADEAGDGNEQAVPEGEAADSDGSEGTDTASDDETAEADDAPSADDTPEDTDTTEDSDASSDDETAQDGAEAEQSGEADDSETSGQDDEDVHGIVPAADDAADAPTDEPAADDAQEADAQEAGHVGSHQGPPAPEAAPASGVAAAGTDGPSTGSHRAVTATIERDVDGVELGEMKGDQAPGPLPAPRFDGKVLSRPEQSRGKPVLWLVWGLIALAVVVLLVLLITGVIGPAGSKDALGALGSQLSTHLGAAGTDPSLVPSPLEVTTA